MLVRTLCVIFGMGLIAIAGCEKKASPPSPTAKAAAVPVRTYTVKGRVVSLPDAGAKRGLIVHHERIAEFYNVRGENTGMNEMEMEFPWLASGVSAEGLAPGDAVELTFSVDWDSERMYEVTRMVKLPTGTALNLKAKAQEGH